MKILNYIIIFSLYLALLPGSLFAIHKNLPSPLASHFKNQYTDDLDGLRGGREKLDRGISDKAALNKSRVYQA